MVAIGGLVHGPCPRASRHLYLAELVRAFPDTHFWALGQLVGDVNTQSHYESPSLSVTHRRHDERSARSDFDQTGDVALE